MLRLALVTCSLMGLVLASARAQRPEADGPLDPGFRAWPRADFNLPATLNTFEVTELSPDVYVDEVGGDTRGHVERVQQFLDNAQWSEAVDMLMQLPADQAGKLIRSGRASGSEHPTFVVVSQYVNEALASLPEKSRPALRQYRQRVDPLCKLWFERGVGNRDVSQLMRLVEEFFNSSYGDDALLVLGELSLESGKYGQARRYWQAIHPGLRWSDRPARLPYWQRVARGADVAPLGRELQAKEPLPGAFPDSDIPLADVWARLTLTSILEGNRARAEAELQIMRQVWPEARGTMAGGEANYAATLGRLLQDSQQWPAPSPQRDWPTYAGRPSRNFTAEERIEIPLRVAWSTPLSSTPSAESQLTQTYNLPIERAGETRDRPCSHFPVVVGSLVLIQEEHRLRCLDLATGMPAWSGPKQGMFFGTEPHERAEAMALRPRDPFGAPKLGQKRFTLSAHNDALVATLPAHLGVDGVGNSAVVGFDLKAEGALRFGPVETEDANWTFHGTPVCDDNWCWVGLRNHGVTSQDYVACYDLRTGKQVWRTPICSAETIGHGLIEETTNQLLTLHEDRLYFTTSLGAIVALGAFDGRVHWLTKYPRTGPQRNNLLDEPWYTLRDLTPCLYYQGMILAAPSDCEQIFALDADSGALVWRTGAAPDATQLLGVGEGNLIVSGRRLWWLDVFTGQLSQRVAVNPFPAGEFAEPVGFGRGVLAGGNVYWPTDGDWARIHVLSQETGRPTRQPIDLGRAGATAGNLLLTKTHLLIAGPEALYAFERAPTKESTR